MRLATRGSALALAQANSVADALDGAELVPVASDGPPGDDKSRFVSGVERALADGRADLGVHSAKDLPGELATGLMLAGVPAREDPRDVLVGGVRSLGELPAGARVGTASLRRRAQLLALRPDLEVVELHGNVDTRLARLESGDYDAIVLAAAGLRRLDRDGEVAFAFEVGEMTPAPGQGAIALEAREGDSEALAAAAGITDRRALVELTAERAVVSLLDASCHTPIGVNAELSGDALVLRGFAGLPDGSEWVRDSVTGDAEQPGALGQALAERMLAAGAGDILARAAG